MEKKNSQMYNIDIKNTKEIYDFCLLNKIMDIDGFINKCFKKGFNLEKYGMIGEVDNEVKGEEEGKEIDASPERQCPICLNDINKKEIIYVECSGVHYTCYDCMIMLTQSQEEPKCPLCRDPIHSMGCLDHEICMQLADRYMI
jgi:hypothetical protein